MIEIPAVDWITALAEAIKTAPLGETIVVRSDAMLSLGMRAAERMGRTDLRLEILS